MTGHGWIMSSHAVFRIVLVRIASFTHSWGLSSGGSALRYRKPKKRRPKNMHLPQMCLVLYSIQVHIPCFLVVCSFSRAFRTFSAHIYIYTQKAYPMRISVVLIFFVEVVSFDPHSILGAKSKQHRYPSNIYKNRWRSRCVCGVVT